MVQIRCGHGFAPREQPIDMAAVGQHHRGVGPLVAVGADDGRRHDEHLLVSRRDAAVDSPHAGTATSAGGCNSLGNVSDGSPNVVVRPQIESFASVVSELSMTRCYPRALGGEMAVADFGDPTRKETNPEPGSGEPSGVDRSPRDGVVAIPRLTGSKRRDRPGCQ